MGFDSNTVAFLIAARKAGASFDRTATIGRQSRKFGEGSLASSLARGGINASAEQIVAASTGGDGYVEPFLRLLDAKSIESFDKSGYENATHLHDMNLPIAREMHNRYTAVIDGGSLEHVFNFPQAIKNCMEMVAVNGHFMGIMPANSLCGHGFYQFSPELLFRIFSEENGFAVERLYLAKSVAGARWLRITDPAVVRRRVEYANKQPTYLYVRARRVAETPVLTSPPLQSDYTSYWAEKAGDHVRRPPRERRRLDLGRLPVPVKRVLGTSLAIAKSLTKKRDEAVRPVDIFYDM